MALGAALKEARMRKKLTASEVAGGTRMKVQTVTAIEEEDFDKIAAPIYAKGFIKLYAEFVGLNPQELVAEYVDRFVEVKPTPDQEMLDATPELISVPPTDPSRSSTAKAEPAPMSDAPAEEAPPAPSPAPEVNVSQTVEENEKPASLPNDDELDLFSEVEPASNERRGILMDEGYREASPSVQDRIGHALAGAVDALQHSGDSIGAACRRALGGGSGLVVNAWKRLGDTVGARKRELTQIDFKNLSARHMMALLGVLVLVLLVISSLSRCVRGKGEVELPDAPLPVAAEPSDVYLD